MEKTGIEGYLGLTDAERGLVLNAVGVLGSEAHTTAMTHGWWEKERSFGEQIALMHSELSEALEAYREDKMSDHIPEFPEFTGIEEEFADVFIRIFDTSKKYGYKLGEALVAKLEYNRTRPYKHGGKKI